MLCFNLLFRHIIEAVQIFFLLTYVDHTGCHHYPHILNVVCLNTFTLKYIACGRGLLNRQDAPSIGSILVINVKNQYKDYNI